MYIFEKSESRWWQKPLVQSRHGLIPAELAVLYLELEDDEEGVWINSRGTKTGVRSLELHDGRFTTVRQRLSAPVSQFLKKAYQKERLARGCPDIVIWKLDSPEFRFVEVKCPLWDRLSKEQVEFIAYSEGRGISTAVAQWVFEEDVDRL